MNSIENFKVKALKWYGFYKFKNNDSNFKTIIDMMLAVFYRIKDGVRIPEQYAYHYRSLSKSRRKELFYIKDNVRFLDKINDGKALKILRDKVVLLRRLGSAAGRQFLYTPDSSYESLLDFIHENSKFIIKPNSLGGGVGVEVACVDSGNITISRNGLVKQGSIEHFAKKWINEDILLEEFITQHKDLNNIYPLCVNSIRIHTVNIDDNVEIVLTSMIRFGSNNANIDFDNGLTLCVDKNGRLNEYAMQRVAGSAHTKLFVCHPDSGVHFKNYQLPYWQEIKQLVIDTAKKVPEICYIGWDVAVTEQGPVIIEGNGAPATYSGLQLIQLELDELTAKQDLALLLRQFVYRKELTSEKIKDINKLLFIGSEEHEWHNCSHVIVLGSYQCKYRIIRAYEIFSKKAVKYILCGQNLSFYTDEKGKALSEAEFMKQYLLGYGVPAADIFVDGYSTNTQQNIENALSILNDAVRVKKVGVVTGGFHMKRVASIVNEKSVPQSVKDNMIYIPAYGEYTRPDNWHQSFKGVHIIMNEL